MLKEQTDLNERSQWKKVKSLFQKDPRYKVIESSSKREEVFNEYVKSLNRVCYNGCIDRKNGWIDG